MGITLLSRNSLKVCSRHALKMSFLLMSGLFNIGLKRRYKDLCYHIYETICTKRPSIKDVRNFFHFLTTPFPACRLVFYINPLANFKEILLPPTPIKLKTSFMYSPPAGHRFKSGNGGGEGGGSKVESEKKFL